MVNPASATKPPGLWTLRTDRLSSHHRVWLNGHLLNDTLDLAAYGRPQPAPFLIQLPPRLLRPRGDNWIELQVSRGAWSGLAPLHLGPAALIDQAAQAQQRLTVALPQQLNMVAAGACLFALLLWWRRRSETAMGWFGLLGLLVSLRNCAYFELSAGLPPVATSALFFIVQVATVLLLGLLAMSITQRRPRGYREVLMGAAALMMIACGVASWVDAAMERVRLFAYPALALMCLPALVLIAQRVRRMRGNELAALLAALVVVMVAGGHDYRFQLGFTSVADNWWLPYATPLMVTAYAILMVGRVVVAMTEVGVLNLTLERRVLERTQALAAAHAAKSRFLAAAGHDLRQPVVTIGLLVGLLREQVTTPAQRSMAARVDEAAAAMESLLAGLLDLLRLESGTVRVRPQRVLLQQLFDAVVCTRPKVRAAKVCACARALPRWRCRPTRCCWSKSCATW